MLTESAAMTLWIGDRSPGSGIVPAKGDPTRATFFRWLAFLVAAVYPTFTYGDVTDRWVHSPDAANSSARAPTLGGSAEDTSQSRLCGTPVFSWRNALGDRPVPGGNGAVAAAARMVCQEVPTHPHAVARRIESDGTLGAILQRYFGE